MSTFTGGTPPISFSNDELYRLGQSISGATAPGAGTPPGGGSGGGGSGGGGWPIPGFVCYDLPWVSTTSATRLIVNMNCDQEACIRFVPQATTKNGWIALVEYNAPRYNRIAVISTIPGDFNAQPGTPPYKAGSSINFDYSTSGAQPFVVDLSPGYTYYLNLKTTNGTPGAPATMSLDLYVPT